MKCNMWSRKNLMHVFVLAQDVAALPWRVSSGGVGAGPPGSGDLGQPMGTVENRARSGIQRPGQCVFLIMILKSCSANSCQCSTFKLPSLTKWRKFLDLPEGRGRGPTGPGSHLRGGRHPRKHPKWTKFLRVCWMGIPVEHDSLFFGSIKIGLNSFRRVLRRRWGGTHKKVYWWELTVLVV